MKELLRNGWFGESWGAPICTPEDHLETPVGEVCLRCEEEIEVRDQGVVQQVVGRGSSRFSPLHIECSMRGIIGGIDHVLHHPDGGCQGECLPDPSYLTKREAAKLTYFLWQKAK